MRTRTLTVALLSALLVASAGTAGALTATPLHAQESPTNTTTSGGDAPTPSSPSVTFDDQTSSGETVLVESATLSEQGFVAIYDSSRSDNRTEQVIGASYLLEPGTSDNIRIRLDQPLNGSASLIAVVHTDSNGNGEFDFVASNGQQDPAPPSGKDRVVSLAQITVENAGSTNGTDATDTATATADGTATTAGNGTATGEMATDETTTGETTTDGTTAGETATAEATTAEETTAGDAADTADETTAGGTNGSNGSGNSGAFGPGFGPVVAVVALLAAALLVARRRE